MGEPSVSGVVMVVAVGVVAAGEEVAAIVVIAAAEAAWGGGVGWCEGMVTFIRRFRKHTHEKLASIVAGTCTGFFRLFPIASTDTATFRAVSRHAGRSYIRQVGLTVSPRFSCPNLRSML